MLDEILLLQKIEKGLEQSKRNQVNANENLDKDLPKWLKQTALSRIIYRVVNENPVDILTVHPSSRIFKLYITTLLPAFAER